MKIDEARQRIRDLIRKETDRRDHPGNRDHEDFMAWQRPLLRGMEMALAALDKPEEA